MLAYLIPAYSSLPSINYTVSSSTSQPLDTSQSLCISFFHSVEIAITLVVQATVDVVPNEKKEKMAGRRVQGHENDCQPAFSPKDLR
jgi:hypothetical protein